MNDVQKFILNRAMQKVASKGMQKEANPIKDVWEKGTDWLAENLFLSDDEKLRRYVLEPDKPVTVGSDVVRVLGTNSDGSLDWGVGDEPIYSRLLRSPKIQHHKDKQYGAAMAEYKLQDKNNPWANLKRKYYQKQYDKHGQEIQKLQGVISKNWDTPYVVFRKQHPEFFEK